VRVLAFLLSLPLAYGAEPVCASLRAVQSLVKIDETRPDTVRIQAALDGCSNGVVELGPGGPGDAFLSGPLRLPSHVILRIAEGASLVASRDPRDYDVHAGSPTCGTLGDGRGCLPLLRAMEASDVAVVGPGSIEGRGWATLGPPGTPLGSSDQAGSWWALARLAKAESYARKQNCPRLAVFERCHNIRLASLTLHDSPNFHVVFHLSDHITVDHVEIRTPSKPAYVYAPDPHHSAVNTDGIDPISSSDITIRDTTIDTGDDQIAIKSSDDGHPSADITVENCRFFHGHGLSIGSETNGGVHGIRARNITFEGSDNGLRIKSNSTRGGLVDDVVYEDIQLTRVHEPLVFDAFYQETPGSPKASGDRIPDFRGITLRNVHADSGGLRFRGPDAAHPVVIHLVNVSVDSIGPILAGHARITLTRCSPALAAALSRRDDVRITSQ
jgi:polygalacturonase